MAVENYIDNTQLGFLVSDAERNLILYMYQPDVYPAHSQNEINIERNDDYINVISISTEYSISHL